MKPIFYAAFAGLLLFTGCANNKTEEPQPEPIQECAPGANGYAAKISPIIQAKCSTPGCHAFGGGGPEFKTYADLKAKVDNGRLEDRVFVRKDMPPSGHPQLTEDELKSLRCWLNNGAQNN